MHHFALFSAVSEVKSIVATAIGRFFQVAPAGQDHFKQSTTRLYFIADKIIEMTMEMYQQPRMMVEAGQFVLFSEAIMKAIKRNTFPVSDIWSNDSFSAFRLPTKHTQHKHFKQQDISALGLRHVGYAIPTELFAPFVSCAVETVREKTTDDIAESAFRWSLTLRSN